MPSAESTPTQDEPRKRLTDGEIVLPSREVRRTNGQILTIRPWGLENGALILERLEALRPALVRDATPSGLLSGAFVDVVDLVALTVGTTAHEMQKRPEEGGWTFEDLLVATEAMIDVCVIRSDGRGALPLLVALVAKMQEALIRTVTSGATKRSNGSDPEATSAGRSPAGSASRTTRKGRTRTKRGSRTS